jgi:Bacterial regulatory proteins, tetR family
LLTQPTIARSGRTGEGYDRPIDVSTGQPGRRARNKADKWDRIMRAAAKLFDERGFNGTTTTEVARAAGIGTFLAAAQDRGQLRSDVSVASLAASLYALYQFHMHPRACGHSELATCRADLAEALDLQLRGLVPRQRGG